MTPEEMQDRDIVEFTDDSGNTLLEVERSTRILEKYA